MSLPGVVQQTIDKVTGKEVFKLSPDALKEKIGKMTKGELEAFTKKIRSAKELPEEIAAEGIQETIEKQGEAVGIDAKLDRNDLMAKVEAGKQKRSQEEQTAKETDEKNFLERMGAKGAMWYGLVGFCAWLGFKWALRLKNSFANRGMLGTALLGVKEHPIFAAFIAATGVGIGTEAYQYMLHNREGIEKWIGSVAGERGEQATKTAMDLAQKVSNAAGDLKNGSVKMLVKGLAFAAGGTYDEKTGVVMLPARLGGIASFRPAFINAWAVTVRENGMRALTKQAHSKYLIQNRCEALLSTVETATNLSNAERIQKRAVAKRTLELLNDPSIIAGQSLAQQVDHAKAMELERCLDILEPELKLSKTKPLFEQVPNPVELENRRKALLARAEEISKAEIVEFNSKKAKILEISDDAQRRLAKGDLVGAKPKDFIKAKTDEVKTIADELNKKFGDQKIKTSNDLAMVMNQLEHTTQLHLESVKTPHGVSGVIETSCKKMEAVGCFIRKNKFGRWGTNLVAGYSILTPLCLEGAEAFLGGGEEGKAAKKAFFIDAGSTVGQFIPGVGEVLDWTAAINGTDLNGRELDAWQRITAGTFATLGTASLALGFFTGGTSIAAFRLLRGAMAGRRAAQIVRKAEKGIEIASVTGKTAKDVMKTVRASEEAVGAAVDMANTTKTMGNSLSRMQRAQRFVHNAQRTMQVVTYGQLGYQVCSGLATIYHNTEEFAESAQATISKGADAVTGFIGKHTPKHAEAPETPVAAAVA